jgi:hypothetical protein
MVSLSPFRENSGTVPSFRSLPPPPTSFAIHYSHIIRLFDAIAESESYPKSQSFSFQMKLSSLSSSSIRSRKRTMDARGLPQAIKQSGCNYLPTGQPSRSELYNFRNMRGHNSRHFLSWFARLWLADAKCTGTQHTLCYQFIYRFCSDILPTFPVRRRVRIPPP